MNQKQSSLTKGIYSEKSGWYFSAVTLLATIAIAIFIFHTAEAGAYYSFLQAKFINSLSLVNGSY